MRLRVAYFLSIAHVIAAYTVNDYESQPCIEASETTEGPVYSDLTGRSTSRCGPAYGNAVCPTSECCSPDGACGTGGYYCFAPSCLFPYGPACDANQIPQGINTSSIKRPQFGSVPYGVVVSHCTVPGKVALTFDDGPWNYTSDLLNVLKANDVKATFFMVGNNNGKGQIGQDSTPWPAVLRRVLNEGHQIGSHSWSHQDLSTLSAQQIQDQIVKNEIAFADVFGFFPTYLRPPYGSCNTLCQSILGSLGYHVLNYDLDTLDWKDDYDSSRNIFSSALKAGRRAPSSFLALAHDIHRGTVYGFVQWMIDTLHSQGYTTALVGECLADAPKNWYRDAKTGQQWSGDDRESRQPSVSTSQAVTTAPPSSSLNSASSASLGDSSISQTSQAITSLTTTTTRPVALPNLVSIKSGSVTGRSDDPTTTTHSTASTQIGNCDNVVGDCIYRALGGSPTPTSQPSQQSQVGASKDVTSSSSRFRYASLQLLVLIFAVLSLVF